MNKVLLFVFTVFSSLQLSAQGDSIQIPSSYTLASNLIMSGTYVVNGTFTVPAGISVTVTSYESNGCGELKIDATDIVIEGTIDGDFAGYVGGDDGTRGAIVSSSTGHESSLSDCNDSGNSGNIVVEGGFGGGGSGGRIKIYVADCGDANINPIVNTNGGTGTYQEVCDTSD